MLAMYYTLVEHLDTTAKLGPLANRVSCASVGEVEERLTTHLALVLLSTVAVVFVVAEVMVVIFVVIVVVDVSMWFVVFGQPLKLLHMYLPKVPQWYMYPFCLSNCLLHFVSVWFSCVRNPSLSWWISSIPVGSPCHWLNFWACCSKNSFLIHVITMCGWCFWLFHWGAVSLPFW